jgi:DNA polymerase-1
MPEPKTLYLVDGSYYIFRAYYAVRGLTNSHGFPTNALFGFVSMFQKLLQQEQPDYLIVTFDRKEPTFRHEMYPLYKANRDAPPEDLVPQFPHFRPLVEAFNIPVVERSGFEADDMMGALAKQFDRVGLKIVIVTGDKDLTQLVTENVQLLDTMRNRRIGVPEVHARFLVTPERVPDVLGLMGDTSDNIPGVPGVGEKTATKLISTYGTIEGVYEHLEDFRGKKLFERLVENRDQAFLSRELATIRTDIPIDIDLSQAEVRTPDVSALTQIYRTFEFTRFLDDLARLHGPLTEVPVDSEVAQHEGQEPCRYEIITSPLRLDQAIQQCLSAEKIALTLFGETGQESSKGDVVGIALSWQEGVSNYIPLGHDQNLSPEQLSQDYVLSTLKPLLESSATVKVVYDVKRHQSYLAEYSTELRGVKRDLMLASYILDPTRKSHTVSTLARDFLAISIQTLEDTVGKGAKRIPFQDLSLSEATQYACEYTDCCLRLEEIVSAQLIGQELSALHDDLELPLSIILGRMERRGVSVDVGHLNTLSQIFTNELKELEGLIYNAADCEFNIGSPKQLASVLFEKMGLPVIKRTKTGASTDHFVLETLSSEHEVAGLILQHRTISKLKNTYTDTLPLLVNRKTGRIHTDFRQTVTSTGRLSSNNPNLQNIPVRTESGRRIREAFVPRQGCCFLSADYSQVELRILAHFSQDPVLLDAFRKGQDIHTRTASELFEISDDEISKAQRSVAKTINFGVLYGMGSVRLSRELQISRSEAKAFIETYFERITGVNLYLKQLVEQARESGYARTLLGHRRPLPELKSKNRGLQAQGERLAVNTPIQGTAADIIKVAMVNVQERLDNSDLQGEMLLQVHDELLFEVPEEELEETTQLVVQEMESAVELSIPLLVDVQTGTNWAAL